MNCEDFHHGLLAGMAGSRRFGAGLLAAGLGWISSAAMAASPCLELPRETVEGCGDRAAIVEAMAGLTGWEQPASVKLERLGDLLQEHSYRLYPGLAVAAGRDADRGRWRDVSLDTAREAHAEVALAFEAALGLDATELEGEERTDYEILVDQLGAAVDGYRFPQELLAIGPLEGVHLDVPSAIAGMPRGTPEELGWVLARLRGVEALVEQHLERLERGLELGVVLPRETLRKLPAEVRALVPEDPWSSPILAPLAELSEAVGAEEIASFRREAETIYREEIGPSFERLAEFLVERYLPEAPESISRADLPDGAAWYAYMVRRSTTAGHTAEAIHALGLREVSRLEARMGQLATELDADGDWRALNERIRTDETFLFDDPESMLRAYRDIAKRADAQLPKLFDTLPRLPYGVRAMPEHMALSAPAAYYRPGSMRRGRAGVFLVNLTELRSRPSWRMVALTLHEAVPGHHLQSALAQELENRPWYRRFNAYSAYKEGWALYAERLGGAMGLYDDPYAEYGQLVGEQWRALRLVVDTGIHALGWTRERAIVYLLEHSPRSRHEVEIEVDRYISWPGQALSYKVGELEILRLRGEAERRLGERFDLRQFHDVVLSSGPVPLDYLSRRVEAWIEGLVRREEASK